jgi:hypothetical protein
MVWHCERDWFHLPFFAATRLVRFNHDRQRQRQLQGTAQKRLAREDIEALPISLPPLPAQERLAVLMDNAIGQKQVATRLLQNSTQMLDHLFLFWQARA